MADGNDRNGPLAGLKVLDLTEHMAGPFCTMILGDMGAEIVKLERPGRGDSVRAWGDGSERNPYFRYINRNKKGITLDYKEPEGKALFLRLVAEMDVLVENYRPHVMPRAGLGFDDLHRLNPRLIYAQLSGLGYDGPAAGRGGFDLIAQGMGGIMHGPASPTARRPRSDCRSATSAPACGRSRASSPPFTSASAPARAGSSNARCWRRRSASAHGPARNGSPTAKSRPGRARAIARMRPISACGPKTAI
jgi:crotonobetainyl-CoA:carnitine CoA-transferase CaiB-like acyl-CoA transferase